MNQKGFATILGLCLIMAIALCVKGIQESEMNHAYETTDFQTEVDLQNAAESGIYAAVEKVKRELALDKGYLPLTMEDNKKYHRLKVISTTQETSSGNISVDVWAERVLIYPYQVDYNKFVTTALLVHDGKTMAEREAYRLSSWVEVDSKHVGRKFSRYAYAYVEIDEEGNSKNTIYFMDTVSSGLLYQPDSPT